MLGSRRGKGEGHRIRGRWVLPVGEDAAVGEEATGMEEETTRWGSPPPLFREAAMAAQRGRSGARAWKGGGSERPGAGVSE